MSLLPDNAQKIEVAEATVDFYRFNINDTSIVYFDTSDAGHPMVNAMAGLQALKDGESLMMINHTTPSGLFPKVEANYNYIVEDLENEKVKVVFTYKKGSTPQTNFDDNKCGGGCDH